MAQTKAVLKGVLIPEELDLPIPFIYNPEVIEDNKDVNYAEVHPLGYNHPNLHYVSGNTRMVSFDLHWNDEIFQFGTLELVIKKLRDYQAPSRGLGSIEKAPPTLTFVFGPFIMRGKLVSTRVVRQRFGAYLNLKEVTISVTIKEVRPPANKLLRFLLG